MDLITVVCVKQGSKYGAEYVNNLLAAVAANLTLPHRLLCVTDDEAGVEFETAGLIGPWTGWWSKLSLFKPGAYGLAGEVLYLDLDTVILRNIDALAGFETDLALLRDFTRPDRYGSGVMKFTAGCHGHIWDNFTEVDQERVGIYGDQEWIWEQVKGADLFPSQWCVSYKLHCTPVPPHSAKVVCFHGEPKPHEILTGWVPIMWNSAFDSRTPVTPEMHRPGPPAEVNWTTGAGLETFIGCGQVRYLCPTPGCKFDSYSPQMLYKTHYMGSHTHQPAPMPTLFDSKGVRITREQIEVPK